MTLRPVSTLSAARSRLTDRRVDCVVLDTELSPQRVGIFHRSIRREQPRLPVVLVADRPRSELPASFSYHAFVRKDGPSMGTAVTNAARVLTAAGPIDDHDTAPATAE